MTSRHDQSVFLKGKFVHFIWSGRRKLVKCQMVHLYYDFPHSEAYIAENSLLSFGIIHYFLIKCLFWKNQWLQVFCRSGWQKNSLHIKVEFLNANSFHQFGHSICKTPESMLHHAVNIKSTPIELSVWVYQTFNRICVLHINNHKDQGIWTGFEPTFLFSAEEQQKSSLTVCRRRLF